MRRRPLARPLAPLLALPLLLVASCSSSDPERTALTEATGTTSPTAATSAATSTASATPAPTKAAATSGATAATSTQAPVSQPLSTQAPGKPAATRATPAGTYTYDASGSVTYNGAPSDVSGSTTFTVSAVRDGVQTSTLHSDNGDTEQTVLVRDAGSYLSGLHLTTPAFDKEFRPSPAALLFPDPATVGTAWSWSATSTDGKSTVKTQHKVVRTETLTIGGKAVQTVVLQSVIAISGDVTYTADVTTWVVPSLRLPVKDHTKGNGTFGAFQVTSDITSVMRSTVPA